MWASWLLLAHPAHLAEELMQVQVGKQKRFKRPGHRTQVPQELKQQRGSRLLQKLPERYTRAWLPLLLPVTARLNAQRCRCNVQAVMG